MGKKQTDLEKSRLEVEIKRGALDKAISEYHTALMARQAEDRKANNQSIISESFHKTAMAIVFHMLDHFEIAPVAEGIVAYLALKRGWGIAELMKKDGIEIKFD